MNRLLCRLPNPAVRRLVIGETISTYGTLVSALALPFVALLYLHRGAGALAAVGLAEFVPGFACGLFAGVWVDRWSRRNVLVVTNAVRFGLVLLVPILAWRGHLTMTALVLIASATGMVGSLYAPAYRAILPVLTSKAELTKVNSVIEGANAAAEILAFASAGVLVQLLRAPTAMLIDACTFLVATGFAASLPATPPSIARGARRRIMVELREGLATVSQHRVLRPLAGSSLSGGVYRGLASTLFVLHVTRTLGYRPGPQGFVYAIGGAVSLFAAATAPRVIGRFGDGRTAVTGLALGSAALLFVVYAPRPSVVGYSMLAAQQVFGDFTMAFSIIAVVGIRQRHTPDGARGRVEGAIGTAATLGTVVGMALAAWLGDPARFGSRGGLLLAAAMGVVAAVVLAPVWTDRAPTERQPTDC